MGYDSGVARVYSLHPMRKLAGAGGAKHSGHVHSLCRHALRLRGMVSDFPRPIMRH